MTSQRAFLLFWLLGILFPMAWFTRFSAAYRRLFELVFTPQWTHVVMHLFLFAVLAYLLSQGLDPHLAVRRGWPLWLIPWALVFGVALLQEGIQRLYTGQTPGSDEALDLGVDLAGGGLGLLVFRWHVGRRRVAR